MTSVHVANEELGEKRLSYKFMEMVEMSKSSIGSVIVTPAVMEISTLENSGEGLQGPHLDMPIRVSQPKAKKLKAFS